MVVGTLLVKSKNVQKLCLILEAEAVEKSFESSEVSRVFLNGGVFYFVGTKQL